MTSRAAPDETMPITVTTMRRWLLVAACCVALSSCATSDGDAGRPGLNAADARALIARVMPGESADRAGWASDIYAAFATQDLALTPENLCAVLAVTEQESTFRADPPVPGLAAIAWQEIDRQADRAGVPKFAVRTALRLDSPSGKTYSERIDAVTTEKQLSEIFEDFIGMVPLGKTFLASRNPVRTGGPMQVSIGFAEAHARVFNRAEQAHGRPVPRAVLPTITLKSPKITRKLTTEWFARRVDERYQRCLSRAQVQDG